MRSVQGVATVVVLVAFLGRLASDRRHNRRIRSKRQKENAPESYDSRAGEGNLAVCPKPSKAASTAKAQLLITLCLLLAAAFLLLLYRGWWEGKPDLAILAGSLAILAALSAGSFAQKQTVAEGKVTAANELLPGRIMERSALNANMTGTWIKDKAASESMADAIALAQLNRITRAAVKLIKGIQIVNTEESFEMAVFSVIAWFKVREAYPWSGELCVHKRRDLRRGHHTGRVTMLHNGYIRLELQWPDPIAGKGYDEFRLVSPGTLHVHSHMEVGGKVATYTTVYKKQ